jgi:hypothetical protein
MYYLHLLRRDKRFQRLSYVTFRATHAVTAFVLSRRSEFVIRKLIA